MPELTLWKRLKLFTTFIQHWFALRWQTFLLLLVGIYLPLLIFILLTIQIWRHEGGLDWDVAILMAIHTTTQTHLDRIAETLTHFGTSWGVFPASILISLVLLYLKRWRSLTYFLLTTIGCGVINRTAKVVLHRVRPSLWEYPPLSDFSFPSGHAMSSMVFVAALVILMWGSRWRWVTLAAGSVFVVAIGWTRLYLGVHYPSDILAGWMAAIAWAMAVRLLVKPQLTATDPQEGEPLQPKGIS